MLPLILSLLACAETPAVSVTVNDIFGKPVEGATVKQETVTENFITDASGKVSIANEPGTIHLMAGKDGYIKDLATVVLPEGVDSYEPVILTLFPEPEDAGFYGVAPDEYRKLGQQRIETIASEHSTYVGLRRLPDVKLVQKDQKPLRFVFKSTLRASEIKQQDIKLHRLDFVDSASVTGPLGPEEVKIGLYVAQDTAGFDFKGLQSKDEYLILINDLLEPGFYAFDAQGILDPSQVASLEKLPGSMQVAYPFEVKK